MKKILLFIALIMPVVTIADNKGICGVNVNWNYVEASQTLIISGTGEMKNIALLKSAPWKEFKKNIQNPVGSGRNLSHP